MQSRLEQGTDFLHRSLSRPGAGPVLHVYIEGDGRPWLGPNRIAEDPTGRRLMMLELAALDPAPILYLGRPCYFDTADAACTPEWWTFYRYGATVVQSMNAVLDRYAQAFAGVALFGHSGGGTLTMLMAARRSDVGVLVTVGGNLDTHAWTAQHNYAPLTGSLDPARQPPLPAAIRQLHLLGEEDEVITREMIEPVVQRQPDAELRVLPDYDHRCCWEQLWPSLLRELAASPAAADP